MVVVRKAFGLREISFKMLFINANAVRIEYYR